MENVESTAGPVVTAVNSLIDNAADSAIGMIQTNVPVIGGVIVAGVLMYFGFKLINKIRRG